MRLLLDEGISYRLAEPLRKMFLDVWAVGEEGCPARGSTDDVNCQWCKLRDATLVTTDAAKRDPGLREGAARHRVRIVLATDIPIEEQGLVLMEVLRRCATDAGLESYPCYYQVTRSRGWFHLRRKKWRKG